MGRAALPPAATASGLLDGDGAQLVRASDRHAADAGSIPLVRQGIFLPESTFNADSLYAR